MKRLFAWLLVLSLLLAGCGGVEMPSPTEPTEATPEPLTVDPRFESLAQEAVVKTALAFLDRGYWIQYDDTLFSANADQRAD